MISIVVATLDGSETVLLVLLAELIVANTNRETDKLNVAKRTGLPAEELESVGVRIHGVTGKTCHFG